MISKNNLVRTVINVASVKLGYKLERISKEKIIVKVFKRVQTFAINENTNEIYAVLGSPVAYLRPSALTCASESRCSFFSWFSCVSSSETWWRENKTALDWGTKIASMASIFSLSA